MFQKAFFIFFILFSSQSILSQKIFSTEYESQADTSVYVVDYESQADLKIFFVDYQSQAGWKKKDKMHLVY